MVDRAILIEKLTRCTRCPDMCMFACPVLSADRNQAHGPSHLAHLSLLIEKGQIGLEAQVVEALYQCIHCRMCAAWCIYDDIDLQSLLAEVRADVIEGGTTVELPDFVHNARSWFEETASPWDQAVGTDLINLNELQNDHGEVLYFAGCAVRSMQPEIAAAAMRVLDASGVQAVFRPDHEPCCGGTLMDMGFRAEAIESESAALHYIEATGSSVVLTSCARCAKKMKESIGKLASGSSLKIMHFSEYLQEQNLEGELKANHDPGRVMLVEDPSFRGELKDPDGFFEYLRVQWGLELPELSNPGWVQKPASAYFGLPKPATANAITRQFLEHVRPLVVETLVTTSAWDKHALLAAARGEWTVQDLIEILANTGR